MKSALIYSNVHLGSDSHIGQYTITGNPPAGREDGDLETMIGNNALIRSHTVIYAGNTIGNDFCTGHSVIIRECNNIGHNVSIGTLSCIEHHIEIGDNVRIHSNVFIPEYTILKNDCWVGPNVVMTNAVYPLSRDVKDNLQGPVIEPFAKIGANTTILPGITIGKYALVGAGSVVTKDIPPYKILAGNPARIIGDVRENSKYELNEE